MSGTKPADDLAERADHEAGHYVAARALRLNCKPVWVSIEGRDGSGGRCFIARGEAPLGHWVQYLLAGIVTETLGRVGRHLCGRVSATEELRAIFDKAFREAVEPGGQSDVAEIQRLIVTRADIDCDPLLELRQIETTLMQEPWLEEWRCLSAYLQRDLTLFGGEANLILAARGDAQYRDFHDIYRTYRRRARPPKEWYDNATPRYPAGPWYENIDTFHRRMQLRPGETEVQREARLSIDRDP